MNTTLAIGPKPSGNFSNFISQSVSFLFEGGHGCVNTAVDAIETGNEELPAAFLNSIGKFSDDFFESIESIRKEDVPDTERIKL